MEYYSELREHPPLNYKRHGHFNPSAINMDHLPYTTQLLDIENPPDEVSHLSIRRLHAPVEICYCNLQAVQRPPAQ